MYINMTGYYYPDLGVIEPTREIKLGNKYTSEDRAREQIFVYDWLAIIQKYDPDDQLLFVINLYADDDTLLLSGHIELGLHPIYDEPNSKAYVNFKDRDEYNPHDLWTSAIYELLAAASDDDLDIVNSIPLSFKNAL